MSVAPHAGTEKLARADWDHVHERIQEILETFGQKVCEVLPATCYRVSKTTTRAFPLFSYCEFSWVNEPDLEEVIAGVDFAHAEFGGIRVRGDIAGAESGQTYYKTSEVQVPAKVDDVLLAASAIAVQLCQQDKIILESLGARRSVPDYRKE